MDDIIQSIRTALPEVQERALDNFINDSQTQGFPIGSMPQASGEKLFTIPAKPTDPFQYNAAIGSAISDLAALYAALDEVSISDSSLDNINRRELDRIQAEVERLEGVLKSVSSTAASSAAYTHMVRQDFVSDTGDAIIIPKELSHLTIDPETKCLTRPLALDISRVTTVDKNTMCKVEIEELLGASVEGRHSIAQAIDGDTSTFWRETILADTPIMANKAAHPWLAGTSYSGGAAVRLRFTFEAVTPVSEIAIKPLADYPMTILDVAWSSDTTIPKEIGGAIDIGGSFATFPGTWTSGTVGTVTATNPAEGQDKTKCLKLDFDGVSTSRYKIKKTVPDMKPGGVYVISFKARSSTGSGFAVLEVTSNSGSAVLTRHSPTISKEWSLYSYVVTMPPGITDSPELTVVFYDKDLLWFDDLQINTSCSSIVPSMVENSSGNIIIPLSRDFGRPVMARTLWLTIAQPNYNLRHYAIPKWAIDSDNLWAQALGGDTSPSGWTALSSPWRNADDLLPDGIGTDSPLAKAAQKLGGKIKSLLAGLIRLSEPSEETVEITKYEYILGAWEIDLRYKDYAASGYWVSKPLGLRGEIRQMTIVPNLGPIEADRVRFFVLPHSNSPIDPSAAAELGNSYNVYFRPTTESGVLASGVDESQATIIPVTPRRIGPNEEMPFKGTDRYKKIKLSYHPYFNAELAASIHKTVTTGEKNKQNRYDPNAVAIAYVDANAQTPTIRTQPGYAPIRVSLNVDGQIVPPDSIGRTHYTRYKVFRDNALELVNSGTTLTETRETTTGSGTTASEQNTTAIKVYKTSLPIAHLGETPRVTLYWHKKNTPDSQDILIDPTKFVVRWGDTSRRERGRIRGQVSYSDMIEVQIDPTYATDEWNLVAFYRTEKPASEILHDPIEDGDLDYKYINEDGTSVPGLQNLALQSYPVTRNMTDYLTGKAPKLTSYNPDRSSKSYYPVYEYYVDASGNVIFASDLFVYGDNPAIITVEYETLDINPRVLIAFDEPEVGTSTCSTPIVSGYTILLNARV